MKARSFARVVSRAGLAAGWSAAFVALLATRQRLAGGPSLSDDDPVRIWARGLLRGLGVQLRTIGAGVSVAPESARLIVANHRSPLDIPIILSVLGGRFLSRGDIAAWPVLGTGARMLGTVFVDRGDTESRTSAIRSVRKLLGARHSVCVFPEGTTHAGDEVRPFQPGVFVTPRGLACELLPVGLTYDPGIEFVEPSILTHAQKLLAQPQVRVTMAIGQPQPSQIPARELARSAREQVQQLVDTARRHHA